MGRVMQARTERRGTTIAFRSVAALLAVVAVVPSLFFVVMSFTDDEQEIHLVHNVAGLAGFGLVLGAAAFALSRAPGDSAGAFRALAIGAVVCLVVGVIAGDLVGGLWFLPAAIVIVLYLLHPDRAGTVRLRSTSVPLLVLGLAALAPAAIFALDQSELQRAANTALDPHAELHHYSGMAVVGLLLAAGVLGAATGGGGKRIVVWASGLGAGVWAVASFAYPDRLGATDTPWAILALAWGAAVVVLAEREARATDAEERSRSR
jgi:hypothetical protein